MSETEDDMTLDEYRGRVLRDAETHGRVVKLTGPQSVSDPSPHAHGVPVEGCVWCDLDTATAVPAVKTESLSLGSMSESMSAERLAEIRARVDAAMPGPWTFREYPAGGCEFMTADGAIRWPYESDAFEFSAHARTDVPDLLAEVDRLARLVADHVKHVQPGDVVIFRQDELLTLEAAHEAAKWFQDIGVRVVFTTAQAVDILRPEPASAVQQPRTGAFHPCGCRAWTFPCFMGDHEANQ